MRILGDRDIEVVAELGRSLQLGEYIVGRSGASHVRCGTHRPLDLIGVFVRICATRKVITPQKTFLSFDFWLRAK